eukprot:g9497.t1
MLVTLVIGAAGAMLAWNVYIIRKQGLCCPPPSQDGTPRASSRGVPDGGKVRRRRPRSSSSRSGGSHDRGSKARREVKRAMAGEAAVSSSKVAMDPVQGQLEKEVRGPSSGAGVPAEVVMAAAVDGDVDGAA